MSANIIDKLRGTVVFDTLKKKGAFFGALPILRPSGAAQAALTDSTGGTAGTTLAAGVGVTPVTIPLTSLATGLSTSAIDLLTGYTPGFRFRIVSLEFVTTVAGTGASASQTFNLEIGTTNVTGGVLTLTLASQAAIGAITAATPITANNIGSSTDAISLEMAAGGTVFTAGAGYFIMELQNLDTADAVASSASLLGAIRSALVSLGLIKGAA